MYPLPNNEVARVFESFPMTIRGRALNLRDLIFEVAMKAQGVDCVEETLKWGEPAYVAYAADAKRAKTATRMVAAPGFALRGERVIGSAVRIGWKAGDPDRIRLLFHCQTTLIGSFRERYARELTFEGNRAIVLNKDDALPEKMLASCIAEALTYHRDKNARWERMRRGFVAELYRLAE